MTSSNLLPRCVFNCTYPFSKITHILTYPLTSLEQFLRAIWEAVSWPIVLSKSPNKTETHSSHVVHFYFSWQFWQPWRDLEQTSLLCLNSTRFWSLGTSRAPCVHLPLWRVHMNLGESLLVLWSPDYWFMILSFIWWCITSTWPPSWKILGAPSWKTLGKSVPQLKNTGGAWLKDLDLLNWKTLRGVEWVIMWVSGLMSFINKGHQKTSLQLTPQPGLCINETYTYKYLLN